MDRIDSFNIYELTADFYYTDVEKLNAFLWSQIAYGDNDAYMTVLWDDEFWENLDLEELTPSDETLISVFTDAKNDETLKLLKQPIAWKDYSSQKF